MSAFSAVWHGSTVVATVAQARRHRPSVVVIAGAPQESWAVAVELVRRLPRVPIVAVVEGAAALRTSRRVPKEVAWAVGPDELNPGLLELGLQHALLLRDHELVAEQNRQLRERDLSWLLRFASHEIGNPLTTLLTTLEVVHARLAHLGLPNPSLAELEQAVGDARSAARHVSRVAGDLRRVSRHSNRMTLVDPAEVLDTARRLSSELLDGVEVQLTSTKTRYVRVDETRLCQVLINLLQNAGRALRHRESPEVAIDLREVDEQVLIRVANNGPSIPKDLVPHLFRSGFTTERQGSGIGLALSRRFMVDMGGRLELVSHDPVVAFEVALPAVPPPEGRDTLVPPRVQRAVHILVVDDDPMVRRAMVRAIRLDGHEIDQVDRVSDAVSICLRRNFDLVISDLRLERSGLDLHRMLVQRGRPDVRICYVSGDVRDDDVAYLEAHRLHWAPKPLGATQLRELITELVSADTTQP